MSIHLAELSWPRVKEAVDAGAVVIVPLGSLEQHGPHLPLETDFRLATQIAERACTRAADDGIPVLMTPPLWTGYSPHHMEFPGTVTLDATTFLRLVEGVATSLWRHGFRKILLLNGHGGNANLLGAAVQTLRFEHGVRAAAASYWSFVTPYIQQWRQSGPGGIDHACEMETSLMLAVREHLVDRDALRDAGWFPQSGFLTGDLAIGAPVGVAWNLAELTSDGALGNGACASGDRGAELLAAIVKSVSSFIEEFHGWDWDEPLKI